jgi:hypothetical protein
MDLIKAGVPQGSADDTAVMAIGETVESSTRKLKSAVNKVAIWTRKWRIKQQPVFINGTKVPCANTAKYLGMTFDTKLLWKEHIKNKRDGLNIKIRKMYWLLGRSSELSIHNKIIL